MRVRVLLRALVIPKRQTRQVDLSSSSSLCAVGQDSLLRLFTGSSSHAPLRFIPLSALFLLNVGWTLWPTARFNFLPEREQEPSFISATISFYFRRWQYWIITSVLWGNSWSGTCTFRFQWCRKCLTWSVFALSSYPKNFTIPTSNVLFVGTVPALNVLFAGTVPAYNLR